MSHSPRSLSAPVLTVLDPDERPRVDAAGAGVYRAIHKESVAEALHDLKRQRVSAVLVSAVRCGRERDWRMATMVREFPTVPMVALVGHTPPTPESLLRLGNAGITRLVDVRQPVGWGRLRELLGSHAFQEVDRRALAAIRAELGDATPDGWRFMEALFLSSERTVTVRALSLRLGVLPSTLMSRFFRARLPSPKRYLAYARLLRAARLLEDQGHSIADVANVLDYSSSQSFGRHVQTLLRMTAGEFRQRHTAESLLEHILAEMVRPHREALRALEPLTLRTGRRSARRPPPPAYHRRRD